MKIREIQLHNYRSIEDQKIRLGDYALLIGANNCGKTNLVDAVRLMLTALSGSRRVAS